jgi:hypothetical protein
LSADVGTYEVLSREWKVARDVVIEWCEEAIDKPGCESVTKGLQEAKAEGLESCRGRLHVDATSATLSSCSCNGGEYATFTKDGDVFHVERVWIEEPGD